MTAGSTARRDAYQIAVKVQSNVSMGARQIFVWTSQKQHGRESNLNGRESNINGRESNNGRGSYLEGVGEGQMMGEKTRPLVKLTKDDRITYENP